MIAVKAAGRRVLRAVAAHGPQMSGALARRAGVTATTVQRLAHVGLLVRGADGRYALTPAGDAAMAEPTRAKPFAPPPPPSLAEEVAAQLRLLHRPVTALAVAVAIDRDPEQVRRVLLDGGPWVVAGVCSLGAKWRAA